MPGIFESFFGGNPSRKERVNFGHWVPLTSLSQWQTLFTDSQNSNEPIAIFKHSTRCGVSSHVKRNVENAYEQATEKVPLYFLDLIQYRSISNQIASDLSVPHQSPQLIVIKNGEVVYAESHHSISYDLAVENA